MTPVATFEEGTEITEDSETVAVAAGWTDTAGSTLFREGPHVTLAVRAKNAAKAAALICTIPPEYRPAEAVKNGAGTVEVLANGEVKSAEGSVALEAAASRVYEINFRAGSVSP